MAANALLDTLRSLESPQFWVVPGSHLKNSMANTAAGAVELPPGAQRLPVPAGSAVVIDRRLWHAGPLGDDAFALSRRW